MFDEVDKLIDKNHQVPFKRRSDKWIKKMDEIDKLDNQMCVWVSANREYFWT